MEQELQYIGVPMTAVQVAWYFNNLENNNPNPHAGWYPWPRDEAGAYVLDVPIGPVGLHGIHNGDVGEACASIFDAGAEYIGRKVALSGQLLTGEAMVAAFRKHFSEHRFSYVNTPIEDFLAKSEASGFGDALYKMYKWYQYRMPAGGDLELSRKLSADLLTFDRYLATHKACFRFEK